MVGSNRWVQWSAEEGGNGHWYRLVTSPLYSISWLDAAQAAPGIGPGTELASLNSRAEHEFVKNNLLSMGVSERLWIGGSLGPDGKWRWMDGEEIGFTNWAPGEPNNYDGTEDKLMIYRDGNWNDSTDWWLSNAYVVETAIRPDIPPPPPLNPSLDVIHLRVAGDGYRESAVFQLYADGYPVGSANAVTVSHMDGKWQDIVLRTHLPVDAKSITVEYVSNFEYGGPNPYLTLYLESITINGTVITPVSQAIKGSLELQIPGQSHGQKPFWLPWSGQATNTVKGDWYGETLSGTDGNDRLDGGLGRDRMVGLDGDDTYLVSSHGDVVVEAPNEGIDSVRSWLDATRLPDNVENLYLNGYTASDGFGNYLDNRLMGNDSANYLDGGTGDDILYGNGGADILVGGAGNDIFAYRQLSDAGDVIMDFTPGTDMIDLRVLRKAFAGPNADPSVELARKGSGTAVVFHQHADDGDGTVLVTLEHVLATQLTFGKELLW